MNSDKKGCVHERSPREITIYAREPRRLHCGSFAWFPRCLAHWPQQVIGSQVLRSGTRLAHTTVRLVVPDRWRSLSARWKAALQELDETAYWLELLAESGIVSPKRLVDLRQETDELIAIFTASVKTAKKKQVVSLLAFIIHHSSFIISPPCPTIPLSPERSWTRKFRDAFRGVKEGVHGQSSFFVHFFVAAAVIAAGIVLGVSLAEWCLLVLCIAGVLTAEMFNSALESMAKAITGESDPHLGNSLDIGSAAVLWPRSGPRSSARSSSATGWGFCWGGGEPWGSSREFIDCQKPISDNAR